MLLVLFIVFNSCHSELLPEYTLIHKEEYIDSAVVSKDHPAIATMIKRANQISKIRWTPIDTIPNRNGVYDAGKTYLGIPYSSVKELDKFVGQEVSFHTFMTAVNNPYSVLYTERVNKPPYNGVNCGAYYGTVCSMAVNYALGIELPYESKMYDSLPTFRKVKEQNPETLFEGDVLWSPGHVVLVLDIQRDSINNIKEISILESAGNTTSIKDYSLADFQNRWDRVGWVSYRYLELAKNTFYQSIPFIQLEGDDYVEFQYNNDICISRGDKACYREGEDVEINILNDGYSELQLYRDDILYSSDIVKGNTTVYHKLPYGLYKARLVYNDKSSQFTYFEVVNVKVSIENDIVNFYSENSIAEYLVICTKNGARNTIVPLSEEMILSNQIKIRSLADNEYVKVFFKGEYGRVSNTPIGFSSI